MTFPGWRVFRDPVDQQLKYQFLRRTASSDPRVGYQAQQSGDLQGWLPMGGPVTVDPINPGWERVTTELGFPSPNFQRMQIQR